MSTLSSLTAGLALGTLLLGAPASQAEPLETLSFGIISTESSQNLKTVWEPFLTDMSAQLDIEVEPFFASDYAGIVQAMRFDKVDVAWYGNKAAMEAVDRAGGEVFAQTVDASGNPGYWSVLIAAADDDRLNSVEDVLAHAETLSFGNGDPNSTSGYLVPGYYVFARNGVDAKQVFKRMTNASHEANFLAVANGQLDVATNNTETIARIRETFPDKYDQVKVIWRSPLIPADPIVWRKNLPESAKQRIRAFFMTYGTTGDPHEQAVLTDLQWAPFRPSSNAQLLPIRQLTLFAERLRLEADTRLSAAAKAERRRALDARLAALEQRIEALEVAPH
ncbi:phosphonate ABC transporter substrate-binding protein [Marichromatium gracile]|uniref:phosphonate ABC transporter substrate-binding protein n=1 Tax=Marichromatium gracile TaxID=1048 RepID=UPI001F298185|nr:phosphonate ABC transporter substrate-binding protein [Marichromatium gracile]MCF1182493.1 phosphonate ABC transporter substrate-binding protein [Marichromatium gracile]